VVWMCSRCYTTVRYLGTRCDLIYLVRAENMDACCMLESTKFLEANPFVTSVIVVIGIVCHHSTCACIGMPGRDVDTRAYIGPGFLGVIIKVTVRVGTTSAGPLRYSHSIFLISFGA